MIKIFYITLKFDSNNIKSILPKFSYMIQTMLLNKIKIFDKNFLIARLEKFIYFLVFIN